MFLKADPTHRKKSFETIAQKQHKGATHFLDVRRRLLSCNFLKREGWREVVCVYLSVAIEYCYRQYNLDDLNWRLKIQIFG